MYSTKKTQKIIPLSLFEQQMEKEENKDVQPIDKKVLKLPEASFKEIPNYTISRAPPLPEKYFDFVEKSQEELDKVRNRYFVCCQNCLSSLYL
jgi:hypothetical protein